MDSVLPDAAGMRRAFGRASRQFDQARVVHDEVRERLLERLDFMNLDARRVLDLGCATGHGAAPLRRRFPDAQLLAMDIHEAMLGRAAAPVGATGDSALIAADARRLPLAAGCVDVVFANLLMPWCDPGAVFAEAARTLRASGVFAFSSLGPDSLAELRSAWARVDDHIHVHAFVDMHDLGDLAVRAGLAEPVMNVERLQVTYPALRPLVADLRACGAINVAGGRRRTLTGRRRWQQFEAQVLAGGDGERFAVTLELIFGHAWGTGGGGGRAADGESVFAADQIPIRRRRGPP